MVNKLTQDLSAQARRPGRPKKDDSTVSLRSQMIEAASVLIAKHGTTDVSASMVCEKVGVTFASVNYNFGSWNGLIAEAGSVVYERYVEGLWASVAKAHKEPVARLRSYVQAQLDWVVNNAGWAALFNYPFSAQTASAIMRDRFGESYLGLFQLNHARLTRLVIDVRDDVVSPFDFDANNYPHEQLLADSLGLARATLVGWTTLGMMVWTSRGPTIEANIPDIKARQDQILSFAMEQIISSIKSDSSKNL